MPRTKESGAVQRLRIFSADKAWPAQLRHDVEAVLAERDALREALRDHVGIHEVERIERRFQERPE